MPPLTTRCGRSAGLIVSIFGRTWRASRRRPIPSAADGVGDVTSVTFNGVVAGLFFVSPGQINALVPWSLPVSSTVSVLSRTARETHFRNSFRSRLRCGNFTSVRTGWDRRLRRIMRTRPSRSVQSDPDWKLPDRLEYWIRAVDAAMNTLRPHCDDRRRAGEAG